MNVQSGTRVGGRYVLRQPLPDTGSRAVWTAGDEWSGRTSLLCAIPVSGLPEDRRAAVRRTVSDEIRNASRLRNPHLAPVSDVLEHTDGDLWVVGDLPGQVTTVQALVRATGAPEPGTVARWGRDVADGLVALHGSGLAHRAVGPGTIAVSAEGSALLLAVAATADLAGHPAAPVPVGADVDALVTTLRGLVAGQASDAAGRLADLTSALDRPQAGERRATTLRDRLSAVVAREPAKPDPLDRDRTSRVRPEDLRADREAAGSGRLPAVTGVAVPVAGGGPVPVAGSAPGPAAGGTPGPAGSGTPGPAGGGAVGHAGGGTPSPAGGGTPGPAGGGAVGPVAGEAPGPAGGGAAAGRPVDHGAPTVSGPPGSAAPGHPGGSANGFGPQPGAGPNGAGPVGAGPNGAGPVGAGPNGAGPQPGARPGGAGPFGAGQPAAGPGGAGQQPGAGPYAAGPGGGGQPAGPQPGAGPGRAGQPRAGRPAAGPGGGGQPAGPQPGAASVGSGPYAPGPQGAGPFGAGPPPGTGPGRAGPPGTGRPGAGQPGGAGPHGAGQPAAAGPYGAGPQPGGGPGGPGYPNAPAGTGGYSAVPPTPSYPGPHQGGPPPGRPRRRRTLVVLLSVLALLVVAGGAAGAVVWYRARTVAAPPPAAPPSAIGDPRTADPCALISQSSVRKYGYTAPVPDFGEPSRCGVQINIGATGYLTLSATLALRDPDLPPEGTSTPAGPLTVFRAARDGNECARTVTLPDDNLVYVYAQAWDGAQADLCAIADIGTSTTVAALNAGQLPRKISADPPNALTQVTACDVVDATSASGVQGIDVTRRIPGFADWSCVWGDSPSLPYDPWVDVEVHRDTALTGGTPTTIGGRDARIVPTTVSGESYCTVALVHRTVTEPDRTTRVEYLSIRVYAGQQPNADTACADARTIATAAEPKLPTA